jgi:FSR family fosmidomycin resistance protein-like MFS transporter
VLDRLGGKRTPLLFAGAGCALTIVGAMIHPALLGLGNALFHVGGGVDVIREDTRKNHRGQDLGIFVAPGAMGLYLGGLLAGKTPRLLLPVAGAGALLLCLIRSPGNFSTAPSQKPAVSLTVCCFLVVVLRSFVGFSVVFPWKAGILAFATVGALVLGKMAGGVLAARYGAKAVTLVSLSAGAVCYALGDLPFFGLLALLCFNMTMPLTLYALWRRFPAYPGSCFGALTLALFLGFVPVCFGISIPIGGVLGSLLSLLLLWKAVEDD